MLYVLSEVRPMMAPAVAPADAGAAQCSRMSATGSTEERSVSMAAATMDRVPQIAQPKPSCQSTLAVPLMYTNPATCVH